MKPSIFTPTHNVAHLQTAYDSLKAQIHTDWEWVVVPNGAAIGMIPDEIKQDPRVKLVPFEAQPLGIGQLKRFACEQATGDVFVELDHDDWLLPPALSYVLGEASAHSGFIYSDSIVANVDAEGKLEGVLWDAAYGWETYEYLVQNQPVTVNRGFPITPRSLYEIFYAPDHVRAWTRDAYFKSGGHDPSLKVGDDHDLICRTYLAGIKFGYIAQPVYVYRVHDANTVKTDNEAIQIQQQATGYRYLHKMIDEWLRRESLGFLDLDASLNTIGSKVAWSPSTGDLNLRLPDNALGCLRVYGNALCRFNSRQLLQLFEECYRTLVPGGWLCYKLPSTEGQNGFAPHYQSYFNEVTALYLSDANLARELWEPIKARFQRVRNITLKEKKNAWVLGDLSAIKGQRQPGRVLI